MKSIFTILFALLASAVQIVAAEKPNILTRALADVCLVLFNSNEFAYVY